MAAALLGTEVDEAEEYLEQLVEAQLLRASETDSSGSLRYRFHDLVRLYAREKMRGDLEPQAVTAAEERLLSGHLALALQYTRDHPVTSNFEFAKSLPLLWAPLPDDVPTPADPMEWLLEERADLVSSVEQAHAQKHWRYVWGLADILHAVFILSHHGPESRRVKDLALAAALAAGDEEAELEVRYTYVSNLLSENRHDEGVVVLSELRERRLRRGEARKVAHLDLMAGVIERDGGSLFAAERSLRRSLDEFGVLQVSGDSAISVLIASAQHNLAIVLREQGRLSEADALLSAALETFDVLDDRIAAGRALHTRGVLHCYVGRFADAQQMFQRSYELCRGVGDRRWTVIALLGQARLADRLRDWPRASLLLDECEAMFTALSDKPGVAQVQRSRAVLLRRTGRYQEAEVMFEAAHAGLKAVNDRRSHARLHYSQALLELARGRRDAAMDFVGQAERLFTVEDDAVWRCRILVARARITGRPEEGLSEKIDEFADLAGEGFQPLWVTEARGRISERS
ncbi:tetratricopeptide repeat protein [Microbispora sp. RL4-1S]|uniref:Tetratricopeptide repeat protein n=1 Tax=Microbispora oryzae TaxID=2806554 RepID=A0A940WTH0_9ACTN|nr:tetratricopeptide repeat protein [Microbispora oryzae]MBP2706719.1 tetratricopeptide repeat protein [Microbispora oryzae]